MNPKSRAAMIRKIERRIRSKYVKRCWLCFIIALVIGLAGGIYLCEWGPLKGMLTDVSLPVVGATPAPVTEVTPTPVAEPTATPVPTVEVTPVPTVAVTPVAETPTPAATVAATPVATIALTTPAATEAADVSAQSVDETGAPVEATAAPTAVTVEATPVVPALTDEEGNVLGTIENPIPMGEVYTFDTEIVQGGTPRYDASLSEFDTINMSISLMDYLTPDYFVDKYSTQYKLTGSEAGAALEMNLLGNSGNQIINPQDMIEICFESEAGEIARGFQLMNAEIAGDYGVPLVSGAAQTYYKRFAYTEDPEMAFLTLTHYVGGQAVKVYFSLEPAPEAATETGDEADTAEAAVTYPTLETGAKGDDVQKLQARLIELGYLEGNADGIFGGMTAAAISAAQENGGMEATGVADDVFQQYIYSDSAVKAD